MITKEDVVADARATLSEWLTGYTFPDDDAPQSRVRHVEQADDSDVYEYETPVHSDIVQRFRVSITVEELT